MAMRFLSSLFAALGMLVAAASPVLAERGGSGGDREPAGGAFMTSYPEQGSTGIQRGGPPRSVDVPRDPYGHPVATGSARRDAPHGRAQPRW
jgi:hypothetical protein